MPDDHAQQADSPPHRALEEDLLTVPQSAIFLQVSAPTVYIAMREGRLPFVIKYDKRLIPRAALTEYKARTQPTGGKSKGRPARKPKPDAE